MFSRDPGGAFSSRHWSTKISDFQLLRNANLQNAASRLLRAAGVLNPHEPVTLRRRAARFQRSDPYDETSGRSFIALKSRSLKWARATTRKAKRRRRNDHWSHHMD